MLNKLYETIKLGNDLIKKKFDDIDEKIDFMLGFCHRLQLENKELILQVKDLETQIDQKDETEAEYSGRSGLIQSKMDGFLEKLNSFSNKTPDNYRSDI